MASTIDECLKILDDRRHEVFTDILGILHGNRPINLDDVQRFVIFKRERGQIEITDATRLLLELNRKGDVVNILFSKLNDLLTWGKYRRPNDQPRYHGDRMWQFRKLSQMIFYRAADVAGWMIGVKLPELSGVDWTAVATAVARYACTISKATYRELDVQVRLVWNALPSAGVYASKPSLVRRTKKGQPPWWLGDAIILLRQSNGQMSDAAIAAAVGVVPSTLSRSKFWKVERSQYERISTVNERLQETSKEHKVSAKTLLHAERPHR